MLLIAALSVLFATQITTAQILSLGVPNGQISNLQRTVNIPNNNVLVANNGFAGIGNNVPLNSLSNIQVARNVPMLGNSNNIINTGNLANFGGNYGNSVVSANTNNNFGSSFIGKNVGANVVNSNVPINLANGFNINTGRFAVGNNGLAALLPANRPCGIQIVAEALEVGGSVGVNGQMPFYTTVAVNGNVPSSGSGVVSCSCGGQ